MNYFRLAPRHISKDIKNKIQLFFDAIDEKDYDVIWNELITEDSIEFLSIVIYASQVYSTGKLDDLFEPLKGLGDKVKIAEGYALAFQLNIQNIRSAFFNSFIGGLLNTSQSVDPFKNLLTFADGDDAISFPSGRIPFIPFHKDTDDVYRIDLEFMIVFSAAISPQIPFDIAMRAFELGYTSTSVTYFELTANYSLILQRIRRALLENPLSDQFITEERKLKLREYEDYAVLARDKILSLLAAPVITSPQDTSKLISEIFNKYTEIPSCVLSEDEYQQLVNFDDKELRRRVSLTLVGFNPVLVEREASKPHGPAEIADLELPIIIQHKQYYLCMPFKSGREIRSSSVPVEIAYQIITRLLQQINKRIRENREKQAILSGTEGIAFRKEQPNDATGRTTQDRRALYGLL